MPEPKRTLNVKTPGVNAPDVDPTAESDADPEGDAAAVEAAVNDTSDVEIPGAVDSAPPDLKAYIDAQIAKGIAAGMKTIKKAQSDPKAPAVELPDQKDIDPRKIDKITLSKQGYVVPLNHGIAPAHIRTQIALGTGQGITQH